MWFWVGIFILSCVVTYALISHRPKTATTLVNPKTQDNTTYKYDILDESEKHLMKSLTSCFARAFAEDPAYIWIFGQDNLVEKLEWLKTKMVGMGVLFHNSIIVVKAGDSTNVIGGAVWLPPGHEISPIHFLKLLFKTPFVFGLPVFVRLLAFCVLFAVQQEKLVGKEKVWHLGILGVDPLCQGQGLSSKLMAPVLAHADENGLACYLETTNPKNLPVYKHFGFEVVHYNPTFPILGGPCAWVMKRQPRNK